MDTAVTRHLNTLSVDIYASNVSFLITDLKAVDTIGNYS